MNEKIYYQAQHSEDGKNWSAFNANRKYNVRESLDEIKEIYDKMVEYHKEHYTQYKYYRIVKFVVKSEVIL